MTNETKIAQTKQYEIKISTKITMRFFSIVLSTPGHGAYPQM